MGDYFIANESQNRQVETEGVGKQEQVVDRDTAYQTFQKTISEIFVREEVGTFSSYVIDWIEALKYYNQNIKKNGDVVFIVSDKVKDGEKRTMKAHGCGLYSFDKSETKRRRKMEGNLTVYTQANIVTSFKREKMCMIVYANGDIVISGRNKWHAIKKSDNDQNQWKT